jgi:hypothetical protein
MSKWLQFRLRTAFVVMAVFGIWLGVYVNRARRVRDAVAAIEKLGGHIQFHPTRVWDVTGLLPRVKWIDLSNTATTDADLALLERLDDVELLTLDGTKVTDAGLVHLSRLHRLFALELNDTAITGAGLKILGRLKAITWLELCNTQIDDGGLSALAGLTELEAIFLNKTRLDGSGFRHLERLPQLLSIAARETNVTNQALEEFKPPRSLQGLDVFGSRVTASGAAAVKRKLPSVAVLY